MPINTPSGPETSLARLSAVGFSAVFILVGILGGWAVTTKISSAVIATGQVGVAGKPKTVQSPDSGALVEILVGNGDFVEKGQVLARLDPTLVQINLGRVRTHLSAALTLRARLHAERTGARQLVFAYDELRIPVSELSAYLGDAENLQQDIFQARRDLRIGSRRQMRGRIADLDTQMQGVLAQITSLERRQVLLDQELRNINALMGKGLSRQEKLTDALRRQAILEGDLAARQSELASMKIRRHEVAEDASQEFRTIQEQVTSDLRDVLVEIDELTQQIFTLQAQLDRLDLRAPADGIVHELAMTTLGGVIRGGDTLLQIIPQNAGFSFEVRVPPRDINQVRQDQLAQIALTALDQQSAPKLDGTVAAVSPETVQDRLTGEYFYRVTLDVPQAELARLPKAERLIAGMPIDVFLQTGEKSVFHYLTEPLLAQISHGFRE